MIHVLIWHAEWWLGEWEWAAVTNAQQWLKTVWWGEARAGDFLFTQCGRWPFHRVPACGAKEACIWGGFELQLAWSMWHMHANCLCLCGLSQTLAGHWEGKTQRGEKAGGMTAVLNVFFKDIIQIFFRCPSATPNCKNFLPPQQKDYCGEFWVTIVRESKSFLLMCTQCSAVVPCHFLIDMHLLHDLVRSLSVNWDRICKRESLVSSQVMMN